MDADRGPLRTTRHPDWRRQGQVVGFGSCGQDQFRAALGEATAIINVPFVKAHHLATMSCCLKNLSHGLIRHPVRFHGNGYDPAIGEVASHRAIAGKLRLNLINGMRVIFDRSCAGKASAVHDYGCLLAGQDPVACDSVAYGILNEVRSLRQMPPLLGGARLPAQLATSGRLGLGQPDIERAEQRRIAV